MEERSVEIEETHMDLNPKEVIREMREDRPPASPEPSIVSQVRSEVRSSYVCPYCKASKRADVVWRWDLSDKREVVIEIECTANTRNEKTGLLEKCENIETRYYGR